MPRTISVLFIAILIILAACKPVDPNENVDEGEVKGSFYTSKELGWTVEIPKGWSIIEKEQIQSNNQKGLKALEETIEEEIDYSQLRNLIAFKKNRFNIFQSTSEPFGLEYEGEFYSNKWHGLGYLRFKNKEFLGEFENGQANGFGSMTING